VTDTKMEGQMDTGQINTAALAVWLGFCHAAKIRHPAQLPKLVVNIVTISGLKCSRRN